MRQPAKYNVIAAFPAKARARKAVEDLTRAGVEGSNVRILPRGENADPDRVAELRAEMQDEVTEGWVAAPSGMVTPEQAAGAVRGVVLGMAIGGFIGLAVGLGWAVLADAPFTPLVRLVIAAVPFIVAGAVAGAIAGGALNPRMEAARHPQGMLDDKRMAAERDTLVAVHVDDMNLARRAERVLSESGAERVDAVNADGSAAAAAERAPRARRSTRTLVVARTVTRVIRANTAGGPG